ncbi:MAG TPA: polyprenol monophosphomannose synthase [Mycobacteriales bacterium]|nr:polyprenol monophosphomannose synthase [Mycobacteriales bacterium]
MSQTAGHADRAAPDRILVVIPTYNEADNIELIVERVRTAVPEVDILVVDDGSPDGTGKVADAIAESDEQVQVMHRTAKAGLGAAYIAGFRWALDRGYDAMVEMDADGSHAPEELPRLLTAIADADLVLGARWIPGGEVRNWPWHRLVFSRSANFYTRLALRMPFHDATAGFRIYRRQVLEALPLDTIASEGYCFQIDLTWQTYRAGYRVLEVPITFTERERGKSKMSGSVVAEALWRVTWWGVTYHGRRAVGSRKPAEQRTR